MANLAKLSIESPIRKRILQAEWDAHVKKTQTKLVGVEDHYLQMGQLGKIFLEIFKRENAARAKAGQNPDVIKFLKSFIRTAKARAKEMGYAYKDIEVSTDSGIVSGLSGNLIEIRFQPKSGAEKLA